jgi:S-adenosylmethionine:tRNA ribosyltransferase-isomerase
MPEENIIRNINIKDYSYELPDSLIAQYPVETRDRSRLLLFRNGISKEDTFQNLSQHLPENCLIIFNETRVVHARLYFNKESGSLIEIFCLEPIWPFRDHLHAFRQKAVTEWKCLVGNSKKWKSGKIELRARHNETEIRLLAERTEKLEGGTSLIRFSWEPEDLSFADVLEAAGKIPLPPYIHRKPVEKDETTYQTIYASQDGSVAAPTAGLHFSDEVLTSLQEKHIEILKFTLHVGAGTFKPVSSETIAGHEMHAEQVFLSLESLKRLFSSLNKPIIAVGTTTVRLLESLYWHGVKVIKGISDAGLMEVRQWDPYSELTERSITREEALEAVISGLKKSGKMVLEGKTSLMIAPGYTFRFPDILITNFHQPKSTLLLLIAAFIGEGWKDAYQFALDHEFRFLSYGDSCLFFKSS